MNKAIHSIFPLLVSSLLFNTTNVLADPPIVGILYSTLHCPSVPAKDIYNISEILKHSANTRKWNTPLAPELGIHWWGKPDSGYYCLSDNDNNEILTRHAQQLSDAKIDFIFFDMTNHHETGRQSVKFREAIKLPFEKLVEVWSHIPSAPKVIPWVRVKKGDPSPYHEDTIKYLENLYNDSNNLNNYVKTGFAKVAYMLHSKPVLFVSPDTIPNSKSESVYADKKMKSYEKTFIMQKLWTGQHHDKPGEVAQDWNYLAPCQSTFKGVGGDQVCEQQATQLPDSPYKHISVSAAYQTTYMSNNSTAVPKFHGKTLIRQFITAQTSGANVVTINDWNSWVVLRQKEPSTGLFQFADSYDKEYNRDLEPGGGMGDYYYQLLKKAVPLLKAGDTWALGNMLTTINDRNTNTPSAPTGYSFIPPN